MYSTPSAGRSVDNLAPLSPGGRADYPFHSGRIGQGHQRPHSRRSSVASSIHSIGGTLDTSLSGGSSAVYESGQNAISTLLQPPIVRTGLQPHTSAPASSSHKPPTARDIPPVTLTNIPKVDPEEFAPYLSQIGALYEQLRRVKENEEEENANRRGSRQDEQAESTSDGLLRPGARGRLPRKGSTASLSSVTSVDTVSSLRRPSALSRKATQGPPPLSTIPTVYFDDDFHLENPRTFDVVSERSEVIQKHKDEGNGNAVMPRKTLATNAILQEKLSWYMDTIEIHLINSISTASTTFFTALGSLKELHSEAADSVQRIKALRKELEALDERVAANGLMMVQKQRRQENLRQLSDAIWQLRLITEGVANCESLVDAGEVEKALASIDSLELLIAGEREESGEQADMPRLRDLRSASVLQGVNLDLSQLRFRIGKAYESQFSFMLSSDIRRHFETFTTSDVLLRWSNAAPKRGNYPRSPSIFPTYLAGTDELKAQLLPVMTGLHRAKHVAVAATAYREEILREIRNLIRRPLPSSNDDDNMSMMSVSTASGGKHLSSQEKSANLARNLRSLDAEDAEKLFITIYTGVTETLRRVSTQVKVLLDIASSLSDQPNGGGLKSPPIRSPLPSPRYDRQMSNPQQPSAFAIQEELHKAIDLGNLLAQAVDLANEKIVKILKVRSEQAIHLPLDLFLRYFNLNLFFTYECEAISGRSCSTLKTVVNNHIKEFVQKYRDAEMQKLAQGMESDQWGAKDFTDENTLLLNQILECSTHDIEAWTENSRIWIPFESPKKLSSDIGSSEANGASKEKVRNAVIESEKFVLPNSAVLCLDGMGDFLQLIAGIPSMTSDIATSLVAYLQLFNSRCFQLILGAGATRSAGLKNITTRHLALASQALAFMATLIPHVREYVRRQAGSGANVSNLMGEFDKIRRLFQEHQDNIHQKLIEIMSGRAVNHAKSIRAINWDTETSEGPHSYIEMLVKETTTLHRVLTKHLPETSIQLIMAPVFASYKTQLGDALRQAAVTTKAGQRRMMRDVDVFGDKLLRIDGFGDAGEFLANIVRSKKVEEDSSTATTTATSTTTAAATNGTSDSKTEEKVESESKKSSEESPKE
ncbi:Vacuolar protein sorting-associated protein Vps45 [Trichoderma simmonsii]|uniref:Vacuolar protein sorting-associated protein Vps45 n=1 Tax=Trichoderma simmonsii TaxID=1491479 RepID=A0A8G0L393_9HYPO|nr:Vacuolar protein sorting-associated protein Vps45 [Trichoderma simmonsii]